MSASTLLAALLAAAAARAGETAPVNALTRVESSRAQAFGGAGVAIGNDPTLAWVNPAAPALAEGIAVTVGGNRGFFGDWTGQAQVSAPLGSGRLTAGLLYYDAGTAEGEEDDGTAWATKVQQDAAVAAGYSLKLTPILSSGAAVKFFHSRLGEQATGRAVAGDLGVQARVGRLLKLGFAVVHAGPRIRYQGDAVTPPTVARAGAAAGWRFGADTLIAVGDLEHEIASGLTSARGGLEYHWRGMIAVRAGARAGNAREPGVLAGGVGVKMGGIRLDYTVRHSSDADLPQTLTLTVAFAAGRAAPVPAPAAAAEAGPVLGAPVPGPVGPTTLPGALPPTPALPIPDTQPEIKLPLGPSPSATAPAETIPPPGDVIEDLNRQLDKLLEEQDTEE